MNIYIKEALISIRTTLFFAVLLCGVFPAAIWGASQLLFPRQANGSLITNDAGQVVGSSWLAQAFTSPRYFHPRPSSAGADGYDATSSGGSNLGPTSARLMEAWKQRAADYRAANGLDSAQIIPADAITASGSGLDPHISIRNAGLQAPRIARERGVPLETVKRKIAEATAVPSFGILGEPGVNVLVLNLSLDKISAGSP